MQVNNTPGDIIDAQHVFLKTLQNVQKRPIKIKALEGACPTENYGMKRGNLYNWVPYWDVWELVKAPIYTRGILLNEIAIDPDAEKWEDVRDGIRKIKAYCDRESIPVIMGFSGGKGVHTHIFFDSFDIPPDVRDGINKHNVDPYKATRQALLKAIAEGAGVDLKKIGLDTKKINFNWSSNGSQIRTFGTTRAPGQYKTYIEEIPEEKPEPFELPLRFPDKVELWEINGTKYAAAAVNAIREAIKKAEKANEYGLTDIDLKGYPPAAFPCIRALHAAKITSGRYYAGQSVILLAERCGHSKQAAEALARELFKTFPGITESETELRIKNALGMYGQGYNFSCTTVKETFGPEFCDFGACPICHLLGDAKARHGEDAKAEATTTAKAAIEEAEVNESQTTNAERAKEIIKTHLLGLPPIEAEGLIILNLKERFGFNASVVGLLKKYYMELSDKAVIEKTKKEPEEEEKESIYLCRDEEEIQESEIREAEKEAIEIMKNGDPMKYILDTVNGIHTGDERTQEGIAVSLAGQSCLNTAGIQVSVNGESGSGKSHGVKSHFHLLPEACKLETSLSAKAPYYLNLRPGMAIFSDDTDPSEDMEEAIKRASTNYQTRTIHTTVKDQECKQTVIPERINWFLTSVESDVSEQLLNRQITFSTDETEKQKNNIFGIQVLEEMTGEIMSLKVDNRVLVCRRIYAEIKKHLFHVKIPFADRFELRDKKNPRIFKQFADMVKGYTIFYFMQRDTDKNGYLLATEDDFERAKKLFESQQESVVSKLSDRERTILRYIDDHPWCSINQIASNVGLSRQVTRNIIQGRSGKTTGGMLGKVKGLESSRQTRSEGYSNEGVRTNETVFRVSIRINVFDLYDGEFITLRPK